MKTLTGFAAIREWQPTWKHHHLPMWIKRLIRIRAITSGKWNRQFSRAFDFLPSNVFDHWGSYIPAPKQKRFVYAMPYCKDDEAARKFASEIGCLVDCFPVGVWNPPSSCLYIFRPIKSDEQA